MQKVNIIVKTILFTNPKAYESDEPDTESTIESRQSRDNKKSSFSERKLMNQTSKMMPLVTISAHNRLFILSSS